MPKISSYTIKKKLEVVQWHLDHGSNVTRTSKHFGIDRKRIREWHQKQGELLQHNYGQEKLKRKLSQGRPVKSEDVDEELFEFLEKQRKEGLAVSNRQLAEEAQRIAISIGIPDFKASCMYLRGWKKRFNISMRKGTSECQKLPEEHQEAVSAFSSAVQLFRKKNEYTAYNIGNMDKTMVRFDSTIPRTNTFKGESSVRITNTGCTKRGFTVALTARASGHKAPAYLIFKEPSGMIPPKAYAALKIPANVRVTSSLNGWMTSDRLQEWLNRIWGSNTDDVRRLLVLDLAPVHKAAAAQAAIANTDSDLVFIPGGCTSILQPADVCWNKPFKNSLQQQWAEFMNQRKKTVAGNLKKPSRQDMVDFVSKAWECVTPEVIEQSFKACGITSALDGSENGLFHSRLADVGDFFETPELQKALEQECAALMFDSDSDEEFEAFSDCE